MNNKISYSTPQEIKDLQEQKLKEQVEYVHKHSAYYQSLFKQYNLTAQDINTLNDLKKIPCTNKLDLQKHNTDFLCAPRQEIIDYSCTSGTTGPPINFGLTEADLNRLAYNEALSFSCAGIKKNDVVQIMTTLDRQFMAGIAYFLGLRKIGAGIIRVGAGIPEIQWESILKNKPQYLVAVPSFLLKLIKYAEKNNIDFTKSSVKGAICIGEPLRNQDLSPSRLTEKIIKKWNIELFSTYASTEMSTAFTECSHQVGGHLLPELIIPEILNENDQPLPPGEIGELTITTLGVTGMPLLRFKTGDLLKIHHEPCECGRTTPRLGPVLGRKMQMIKYKGTTLYPPAIQNTLNNFDEINGYAIVIKTGVLGTDEVSVHIHSSNESNAFITQLKQHFKTQLRVIPEVHFIDQGQLRKLLASDKSRKPRSVIDYRDYLYSKPSS